MNKTVGKLSLVLLALAASCTNTESNSVPATETKTPIEKKILSANEMVARGEYLVNTMGCDDCHSPKKMGPHGPELIPELRFSGYPSDRPSQKIDRQNLSLGWVLFNGDLTSAVGPWGQSFAANITSDPTGLGNWTEENFLTCIKKGKYKGIENGRNLLPPMPWFTIKNLTDEDLKSIFAFLQTTKPVNNIVPAPIAPNNL